MTELEKKAAELNAATEKATELQAKYEALMADLEGKESTEIAELKTALNEAKQAIADLEAKSTKKEPTNEVKSFGQAFEDAITSEEFKTGAAETLEGKRASFKMELKNVTLASVTNPIATTMMRAGIDYIPQGETPLMNLAVKGTVPAGKNKVGYFEGDFAANTGYVAEMAEMTAKSGLTGSEKSVEVVKYGTFMPYSAEFLRDNGTVLSWGQNEALSAVMIGVEGELLSGIGDDTTNKSKIRGLDKYSTAFDKTIGNIAVENPTVADLINAMKLQVRKQTNGGYMPTHVLMSADDVAQLKAEKDANKNPLQFRNVVMNADGTIRIEGMQVVESLTLTKGTYYVITQRAWNLYSTVGFEIEIQRVPATDSYVLYVRWRGQALITEKGKLGIVKGTSANLADITKV